jgi:hypothetical protein
VQAANTPSTAPLQIKRCFFFLGHQDDRHAPPRKVKGQLVNFVEAVLEPYIFRHLDMVEHGNVEQVFLSQTENDC